MSKFDDLASVFVGELAARPRDDAVALLAKALEERDAVAYAAGKTDGATKKWHQDLAAVPVVAEHPAPPGAMVVFYKTLLRCTGSLAVVVAWLLAPAVTPWLSVGLAYVAYAPAAVAIGALPWFVLRPRR